MNFKKWPCLLFPALFLCSVASFGQSTRAYNSEVEERIRLVETNLRKKNNATERYTIEERLREHNTPGVSIAVINNYKLEWAKGYGLADSELKLPVTANTLFQAASISKSLNAVGVLRLVQENKIDLDSDINNYLTSWKFPYEGKSNNIITLANLLSHTAGTGVHGFWGYRRDAALPTVVQILNGESPSNSKAVRAVSDPGKEVKYSGGGTMISQQIIMDITGRPYDEYLFEQVLSPLGMSNSFFSQPPPEKAAPFLATGHRMNGKPLAARYFLHPEQAAAGLWTNPTELGNFITAIQRAYQGKSGSVLKQDLARRMLTPFLENAGLGVFIQTRGAETFFAHGGSNQGFRCVYMGSLESGKGVIIMCNSENFAIGREIVLSIASVYGWDGLDL